MPIRINLNVKENPFGLDEYQAPPVDYDGSVYLSAGPGSGKTRCLAAKAGQLDSKEVPFIALTFTVKASEEMKSRLSPDSEASTIHSFCLKYLGKGHRNYHWKSDKALLTDFLDMKSKPKYPHILVDECQDLNELQVEVIESIMQPDCKIFAVGDIYQCIYDFPSAGALGRQIEPILDYYNCKRFGLINNYRSTPEIVNKIEGIFERGLVSTCKNSFPNTIGILARTNENVDLLEELLEDEGIEYTRKRKGKRFSGDIITEGNSQRIFTMTNHCCKGLEFNRVFALSWNVNNESEERLEYVVTSRAMTESRFFVPPYDLLEEVIKCL